MKVSINKHLPSTSHICNMIAIIKKFACIQELKEHNMEKFKYLYLMKSTWMILFLTFLSYCRYIISQEENRILFGVNLTPCTPIGTLVEDLSFLLRALRPHRQSAGLSTVSLALDCDMMQLDGQSRAGTRPLPLGVFLIFYQICPPLHDKHIFHSQHLYKWLSLTIQHLSIWDRNLVSKMPLVLRRSEICPRKRRPCLVKSMRICRTISPRYMPLVIFSYLFGEEQ